MRFVRKSLFLMQISFLSAIIRCMSRSMVSCPTWAFSTCFSMKATRRYSICKTKMIRRRHFSFRSSPGWGRPRLDSYPLFLAWLIRDFACPRFLPLFGSSLMTGACHQWRPRLVRLLSLTSGTREAFFRLLVQRYNFWELKTNYFATDFGGIFVSAWLITFYRDILVIVLCILIDLEEKWRLAALDFDEAVIWSWSSSVKIISGGALLSYNIL